MTAWTADICTTMAQLYWQAACNSDGPVPFMPWCHRRDVLVRPSVVSHARQLFAEPQTSHCAKHAPNSMHATPWGKCGGSRSLRPGNLNAIQMCRCLVHGAPIIPPHCSPAVAFARCQYSCLSYRECAAPVVAYGHYPLGVVTNGQEMKRTLQQHGVAAYLSGHLHASCGQRTHHLHRTDAGDCLILRLFQ